jgi:hypothetical protein
MQKFFTICFLLAVFTVGFTGLTSAQDMTPEQQAAMMKAMQPGEHHKHLARFAGKFEYTSKMWMQEGTPPMESRGSSVSSIIMGGRYLEDAVKGDFGGMPFEGRGLMGYDNVSGEYTFAWIDNMGTGIMRATGKCSENGKTITLDGTAVSPETGGEMPFREVIRVVDAKHHVMEFYGPSPDGGEMFKMMELTYTRLD